MKNINEIGEKYKNFLENLSDEQLDDIKTQAILDEDYDKAKEIKQEQERRKMKNKEWTESNDEKLRQEEKMKEIEDEKKTNEIQKAEKLKSAIDSLKSTEDEEKLWETIEISNEEIDAIIDLTEKIRQINPTYGDYIDYGNEFSELKKFDINQKKEYFKRNKIQSRIDFYTHILDCFLEEFEHMKEYNLNNHTHIDGYQLDDTLNSLKLFCEKFIDTDKELATNEKINEHYFEIEDVLNRYKKRLEEYINM